MKKSKAFLELERGKTLTHEYGVFYRMCLSTGGALQYSINKLDWAEVAINEVPFDELEVYDPRKEVIKKLSNLKEGDSVFCSIFGPGKVSTSKTKSLPIGVIFEIDGVKRHYTEDGRFSPKAANKSIFKTEQECSSYFEAIAYGKECDEYFKNCPETQEAKGKYEESKNQEEQALA